MAMLEVKTPTSASPGESVPVVICANRITGLACTFEIEAWWTEGTDVSAYERLDNPSQCHYLGKKTISPGQCANFGSYTQPGNGSYIRFKITQIPPATTVSGVQKCPAMSYYLDWKVTTGGLAYPNVQFNANASPTTVNAGGTVRVTESVRILNDTKTHSFQLYLKTPWGTTYRTTTVSEPGNLGVSASFSVRVPTSYNGQAVLIAQAYADGRLIAEKRLTVNVVGGAVSVRNALMNEVRKWYHKTVAVPGVPAGEYDWSYDVTQTVRQVIPNVSRAYLYGPYKIVRYAYIGPNKPPKRTAQQKVATWRQGYELALIYLSPKEYPHLEGRYGWYWVWLPAKLKLYYTGSPGQTVPVVEQKTGPLSGWWPLAVAGGILLLIDRAGKHP